MCVQQKSQIELKDRILDINYLTVSKPQLLKKKLFQTFASDCEESSFDVAVADKVEENSVVKDVIGGSKVADACKFDSYCCRCLSVYTQKWFNITSLMSAIGADVLGASQLFPDVENEPKVADDALIDVSNRTDVLFCWMYRQWRGEA